MKSAHSTILAIVIALSFLLSGYVIGQGRGPAVAPPPSGGTNPVPVQGPQPLNPATQINPAAAPANTIAPLTTPTIGPIFPQPLDPAPRLQ